MFVFLLLSFDRHSSLTLLYAGRSLQRQAPQGDRDGFWVGGRREAIFGAPSATTVSSSAHTPLVSGGLSRKTSKQSASYVI